MEEAFGKALALDAKEGGAKRGMAWIALREPARLEDAGNWAREAMVLDPSHPGSSLVDLAVRLWDADWLDVKADCLNWFRSLGPQDEWFAWRSRRLAFFVRKILQKGGLEDLAEILRALTEAPHWKPWSVAIDAVLAGKDVSGLDNKAAEIFRLLTRDE